MPLFRTRPHCSPNKLIWELARVPLGTIWAPIGQGLGSHWGLHGLQLGLYYTGPALVQATLAPVWVPMRAQAGARPQNYLQQAKPSEYWRNRYTQQGHLLGNLNHSSKWGAYQSKAKLSPRLRTTFIKRITYKESKGDGSWSDTASDSER